MKKQYIVWGCLAVGFVFAVWFGGKIGAALAQSGFGLIALLLFVVAFGGYIFWNLRGTGKAVLADPAAQAAALSMTPPAGQALVYVYREGFVAKLAGMNINLDGKTLAQLTAPRFTSFAVSPGQHTVSGAFAGGAGAQTKGFEVAVSAVEGGVYAYRVTVEMGALKNGAAATPVTDLAIAKDAMSRMKMVVAASDAV